MKGESKSNIKTFWIVVLVLVLAYFGFNFVSNNMEEPVEGIVLSDEFMENPTGESSNFIPSKLELVVSYDGPTDLPRYDVYGVRSAQPPFINRIYFNPLDVWQGEEQTIVVQARNETPIVSMQVFLKTDSGSNTYDLELVDGSETDGYWSGTWVFDDTHLETYDVSVVAKSDSEESNIDLTFAE